MRAIELPATLFLGVHEDTILYWDVVDGLWRWVYPLVAVLLLFIGLLIGFKVPWGQVWKSRKQARDKSAGKADAESAAATNQAADSAKSAPRTPGQCFAAAFWSTVMLCSLSIWIDTIYHRYSQYGFAIAIFPLLFFLLVAFSIAFLTFVLEGLEIAHADLRDKDQQQLQNSAASRVFFHIHAMGEEAFVDAREWAVIALLVVATLLIEKRTYYLPFMGVVSEKHSTALLITRFALTIALTAFSLVWVAQSPGKYVARHNSVEFLSYISLVPLKVLRWVWWVLCRLGLQYPSELIDKRALELMHRCKKARSLVPSDLDFFADSLKKYGYGFLISDDTLNVQDNGSIEVVSRTLHYIGSPKRSIKRHFVFEKGFKSVPPAPMNVRAFEAPPIGEKIDHALLKRWEALFYGEEESEWRSSTSKDDFIEYPSDGWRIGTKVVSEPATQSDSQRGTSEPGFRMTVEIDFGQSLPESFPDQEKRALLVLWETRATTNDETFPLPKGEETRPYPYWKKHAQPCFRSAVITTLPASSGCVFVPEADSDYRVTYEDILHQQETERFLRQVRTPEITAKNAPKRDRSRGLKTKDTRFMDSSLPAAKFEILFHVRKLNPNTPEKRGDEPMEPAQTAKPNLSADAAATEATRTAAATATDATAATD